MKNKLLKKATAIVMAVGCLVVMVPSQVYACTATLNCFAESYDVVCGRVYGSTYGHQVTDENGYTTWCTVSVGTSVHSIQCSGCGAEETTETRTCFEQHSHQYCQDKNYVCQYGWEPPEEEDETP